MKWAELKKIITYKGWYLFRHGAKHDIYAHKDSEHRIAIGRHNNEEIPTGTFRQIKKIIGF
ncbi:MAG: type II toxin-antitoxin system HicA family toxin [Bacteroidales bacterium]|nr:type II toxin-antitoxin system HicA family toxin [Bacteroidales bacterium]